MTDRPKLIAGVDLDSWVGGDGDDVDELPAAPPSGGGAAALRSLFGKDKAPILVTSDVQRHNRIKSSGKFVAPPNVDPVPPTFKDTVVRIARSMTGLPVNNRSNAFVLDSTLPDIPGQRIERPVLQFYGKTDDTDMLTVQLGLAFDKPLDSGTLGFDGRVLARLTWGTGNVQQTSLIDWLQGMMIALPANYLDVKVLVPDNSGASPPAGSTIPLFKVSAAVGYGVSASHRNRARFTAFDGIVQPNTTSVPIPIPPFAVGIGLCASNQTSGGAAGVGIVRVPIGLRQRDTAATNVFWDYRYATGDNFGGQETGIFPVMNGAYECVVRNLSGSAAKVTVFFDLVF